MELLSSNKKERHIVGETLQSESADANCPSNKAASLWLSVQHELQKNSNQVGWKEDINKKNLPRDFTEAIQLIKFDFLLVNVP